MSLTIKRVYDVVTVTDRGRIPLPIDTLRSLGWQPGDKVVVTIVDEERGVFSLRKATPEDLAPSARSEAEAGS